jgi:hypothetical protein
MKPIRKKRHFDIPLVRRMLLLICGLTVLVESHALTTVNDSTHREKEVTVLTGICTLSSIDELYSFQKYSGNNVFIGMTVGLKSLKNWHYINVLYSGINRAPQTPPSSGFIDEGRCKELKSMVMDLDYKYFRKIYSRHLNIFVSANWINHFNLTKGYRPEIMLSSFAPGVMVNCTRKRHSLGMQLAVPVVSLTLRNAYHISHVQTSENYDHMQYIKDNLHVQSLGELRIMYAQLTYRYSFSEKFCLETQYHLRYISDSEPRRLKSASGFYCLGLTCKF